MGRERCSEGRVMCFTHFIIDGYIVTCYMHNLGAMHGDMHFFFEGEETVPCFVSAPKLCILINQSTKLQKSVYHICQIATE